MPVPVPESDHVAEGVRSGVALREAVRVLEGLLDRLRAPEAEGERETVGLRVAVAEVTVAVAVGVGTPVRAREAEAVHEALWLREDRVRLRLQEKERGLALQDGMPEGVRVRLAAPVPERERVALGVRVESEGDGVDVYERVHCVVLLGLRDSDGLWDGDGDVVGEGEADRVRVRVAEAVWEGEGEQVPLRERLQEHVEEREGLCVREAPGVPLWEGERVGGEADGVWVHVTVAETDGDAEAGDTVPEGLRLRERELVWDKVPAQVEVTVGVALPEGLTLREWVRVPLADAVALSPSDAEREAEAVGGVGLSVGDGVREPEHVAVALGEVLEVIVGAFVAVREREGDAVHDAEPGTLVLGVGVPLAVGEREREREEESRWDTVGLWEEVGAIVGGLGVWLRLWVRLGVRVPGDSVAEGDAVWERDGP